MRKRVIILKMSLLLVCLSVRAQTVMPAHVSIDILGFDKYNEVAIACKHNPAGRFRATHEFNPDPRVETIISGPRFAWTISPKTPDVSFSPTDKQTVQVKMMNDAAYGKEYSVKVVATWTVRIKATGVITDVSSPEATVTLVANILLDIDWPKENKVFLKGERLKFYGVADPEGLNGKTYAWSVLEGTCDPATATTHDFKTTLKSTGTIKVKLTVKAGNFSAEQIRTILAVLPEVVKISWKNDIDIFDHMTDTKIDDPVWIKTFGGEVTKDRAGAYKGGVQAKTEIEINASEQLSYNTVVRVRGDGVSSKDEDFISNILAFYLWPKTPISLESVTPLVDYVNCYDKLNIRWEYQVQDEEGEWGEFTAMNTSSHLLYTTLNNAVESVKIYEKLLDFSCRWAINEETPSGVFNKIWARIHSRNATGYKYYGVAEPQSNMLSLLRDGDGRCGAWSEFFKNINAVHGISVPQIGVIPKPAIGIAFLVRNASLQYPPNHVPEIFAWDYPSQVNANENGLPGQGMPTPKRKAFTDHGINVYGGQYYDPSYGDVYSTLHLWEESSLEGYINTDSTRIRKNDPLVQEVQ